MLKTTPRTKAWKAFAEWIWHRDALKTTGTLDYCVCITCGRTKPVHGGGSIQAGHFTPGRGNAILFDEECVNGQCFGCNCGQGGMWVEYEEAMSERYSPDEVAEMKRRKYGVVKYTPQDYKKIELKYKQKLKELEESS